MSVHKATDKVFVCGQLSPAELDAAVKEAGLKSFVSMRCSSESGFVSFEQYAAESTAFADLESVYIPTAGLGPLRSVSSVDRSTSQLDQLPTPILIACASGRRAGLLASLFLVSRGLATGEELKGNSFETLSAIAADACVEKYVEHFKKDLSGPTVKFCFQPESCTCVYVVWDPRTKEAIIIDLAAEWNNAAGRVSFKHAEGIVEFVKQKELKVKYLLETHAHADHISAAPFVKKVLPNHPEIGIGCRITVVQEVFSELYNLPDLKCDGSSFDLLLEESKPLTVGGFEIKAMHTPGHTPACMTYVIGDCAFTGDTLFMPDIGSARCDFPKGSATQLWNSIQRIMSLPDDTRMFIGHDYPPSTRKARGETSVKEQRETNKHLMVDGKPTTEEQYVAMRTARDATLNPPRALLPSLQCNIRAGQLPGAESNGTSFLKIPINKI